MAKIATLDDAMGALDAVKRAMHEQHPDNAARLEQLDAALATAAMVVEHLYDEAVRHAHDPVAHRKAIGEYVREN